MMREGNSEDVEGLCASCTQVWDARLIRGLVYAFRGVNAHLRMEFCKRRHETKVGGVVVRARWEFLTGGMR